MDKRGPSHLARHRDPDFWREPTPAGLTDGNAR